MRRRTSIAVLAATLLAAAPATAQVIVAQQSVGSVALMSAWAADNYDHTRCVVITATTKNHHLNQLAGRASSLREVSAATTLWYLADDTGRQWAVDLAPLTALRSAGAEAILGPPGQRVWVAVSPPRSDLQAGVEADWARASQTERTNFYWPLGGFRGAVVDRGSSVPEHQRYVYVGDHSCIT